MAPPSRTVLACPRVKGFNSAIIQKGICMRLMIALLGVLLLAPVFSSLAFAQSQLKPVRASAYDRVLASGTLRCGYIVTEALQKDPNTGAVTGIIPEILEEAANLLNLKIEWTEELVWSTYIAALQSGRVDAICTNLWMEPVGGRYLGYSLPLYFSGVGAYVRQDETRFDASLQAVDAAGVRIATMDGEMADLIAKQDFPAASRNAVSQLGDSSQLLMEVMTGKADITFVDVAIGNKFQRSNPGKVRNLVQDKPLRVFPNTIGFANTEIQLKFMLDSALSQLVNGGFVDKTLEKHSKVAAGYYRVAKPYETRHETGK